MSSRITALERPPRLAPGDRVAVVAPSGPVPAERLDIGSLPDVNLPSRHGAPVPLAQVATVSVSQEAPILRRWNREPTVIVRADVADDAACRALVDATVRELGRVDVLVQSAGVTSFIPHANLDAVTAEDWQRILGVNLVDAFQMARAVKAPMDAAGAGAIVNVSSVAGIAGVGSSIPYCASKAGMNNLTITLARALAPKIRVNGVAPGPVLMPSNSDREQLKAAVDATGVDYVDPKKWFCAYDKCPVVVGDFITHRDRGHMTLEYGRSLAGPLARALGLG